MQDRRILRKSKRTAARMLNRASRFGLKLQAMLARFFLPLLYPTYHILLRFIMGYRMPASA